MRLFDLFQGRKSVDRELRLGLMENWRQFSLLVALNLFVGGMIGLERTILPVLAEAEFGITSKTAAISFIATFGISSLVQPIRRESCPESDPAPNTHRRMAVRIARTHYLDLGAGLGLGDRGQRPAGYQPRVDLVDDGEYEDGPGWP
jgi:hypothetical protein